MNAPSAGRLNTLSGVADVARTVATVPEEKKMTNLALKTDAGDFIRHPGRPTHVHQCSGEEDGKTAHAWLCDSPYCEVMAETCTVHGGMPPIRMGREPWRSR